MPRFAGFKSCTIMTIMILLKPHVWEKRARTLVVSDLRSETIGYRFESGCYLFAELSSFQQSLGLYLSLCEVGGKR